MSAATILIADDDRAIRTVLTQALARLGHEVRTTGNAATLWRWVADGQGDLVITDVVMPDENGLDLIPRIKKLRPELRVVVMSAQNTLITAVKAAERGAFEYLPKPFDLKELVSVVERALNANNAPAAMPGGDQESEEQLPLIGRSPAMQEIYRVLARLMGTDLTVMITGESGTGKELVARALHDYGKRRNGAFVAINMAAIPRELIESELFGHEKGAFTGATNRSTGRFEQAQGGTLFLDEIGDMPLSSQTRLLRVLAEREVTPIGRTKAVSVDVRVIGATHRDLVELVKAGRFRDDLYFRLNGAVFTVPPLRQRGDLDWLIERLLAERAERDGVGYRLTPAALAALRGHSWPGNVRELVNALDYACAVSDGGLIDLADIPEPVQHSGLFQAWPAEAPGMVVAEEDPAARLRETLRRHHWNVSATARALGVDRSTIHRQMHRFGVVAPHRAE